MGGLDLAKGMSTEGKSNIAAGNYPAELVNLRDGYMKDVTDEQFKQMLWQYIRVVQHRAKRWKKEYQKTWLELHPSNEGMWGSRRQWAYGEVVSRLLAHFGVTNPGNDLHPVFAIMLNPAGGIAGYSNLSLLNGDMHTSVIVHAVVHDAYGYVGLFHNVGPGYNYLAINSMFSNDNCLSCQLHGILQTRGEMKRLGLL